MQEHVDHLRSVGDAISISAVIATLAGWLPAVAALASLIWTVIRIFETATVQKFLAKFRK